MEVICLEQPAFYELLNKAYEHIKTISKTKEKWISTDQAMTRLQIKSKTTLQKLRDEGSIRFSQPEKKWIVYDADSIDEYLEKHAKNPM